MQHKIKQSVLLNLEQNKQKPKQPNVKLHMDVYGHLHMSMPQVLFLNMCRDILKSKSYIYYFLQYKLKSNQTLPCCTALKSLVTMTHQKRVNTHMYILTIIIPPKQGVCCDLLCMSHAMPYSYFPSDEFFSNILSLYETNYILC